MERWPGEEDHIPVHYSMPHGFGVRNNDGPNHVEIFDIINIHSHHRAISETTCLCDIFGDDCESPTLSCSPASDFLTMKEVDDFTVADDSNNESSGSYHTAVCSEQLSDSSETFEDCTETHAAVPSDTVLLSSLESIDPCSLTSTGFEPSNVQSTGTSPTLEHIDLSLQSKGATDQTDTKVISPSVHPGDTDIYYSSNSGLPSGRKNTTAILDKRESNHSPNTGCPNPSLTPQTTAPTPMPRNTSPSLRPEIIFPIPTPRNTCTSLRPQIKSPIPTPRNISPSLTTQITSPIPTPRNISPSLRPQVTSPLFTPTDTSPSPTPRNISPSLTTQITSPIPTPRNISPSLRPQTTSPIPTPSNTSPSLTPQITSPIPTPKNTSPSLRPQITSPSSTPTDTSPSPIPTDTSPSPTPKNISPSLRPQITSPSSTPTDTSPSPTPKNISPSLRPQTTSPIPTPRNTSPSLTPQTTSPIPTLSNTSPSLTPQITSPIPTPRNTFPSLRPQIKSPLSTPRNTSPSSRPQITSSIPTPRNTSPSLRLQTTSLIPTPRNSPPSSTPTHTSPSSTPKNTSTSPKLQTTSTIATPKNTSPSPTPQIASPSPTPTNKSLTLRPQITFSSPTPRNTSPSPKVQSAFPSPGPRDASPSLKSQAASQLLTSGIILTSVKPQTTSPSPTPSTISPSLKSHATCPSSNFGTISTSPKPHTAALSPKPDPRTTGLSAESGDDTNGTNLWHEPKKTNILSKPGSSKTWGPVFSPECKVIDSAQEDTPLFKQNKSNNSFSPELSGLNFSHKPCNTDRDSPAVGLENNVTQKSFCSLETHSTSDTVLNEASASANRESRLKGEKSHSIPPTFGAAVNPKSSSRGNPCTAELNNYPSRDRGDEMGEGNMAKSQWEGEGKWGENGYREEQVELSFIAKNRKVPVSHSPPATYRRPQTRMPARCYSECLLATRQQQHQNCFGPQSSQHDHPSSTRKPQVLPKNPDSSTINSTPDCASGSSSMGSELDETDNEVKWFTDLAFKSLSSPQVDYLDVYNSSHRSSTNMSQPSTEDSTGANAWSAYADLRGSVRYENDEPLRQPPTALSSDGLKRAKRFEMGSFECVDVALESGGEAWRGKRTVPKRQIQLKKRDTCEPDAHENSGDTAEASSTHKRHSKDVFLRQHSTPAAVEEESYKSNSDLRDWKQKLQKSVSLDETSGKTRMATCFIKNVLSKKMQQEHKDTSQQVPFQNRVISPSEPINETAEMSESSIKQTSKAEVSSLSSELPSECSLSSEDLPGNLNKQHEIYNSNPQQKPSRKFDLNRLQSGTTGSDCQSSNAGRMGMRSELLIPFENKKNEKPISREEIKQLTHDNMREKNSSDSASAISGNTSEAATRPPSTRSGMTNRNKECYTNAKPDKQKQQSARNIFTSKTPEITLKSSIAGEKKTTSIKVPRLSPGLEIIPSSSPDIPSAKAAENQEEKIENQTVNEAGSSRDADPGTNKSKGPMHKVKDVRKMVKNSYSLSFKATAVTAEDSIPKAQEEKLTAAPPLQIEFKAISRKEEKAPVRAPAEAQKDDKAQQEPSSQILQDEVRETASIHITPRNVAIENVPTSELHEETPDAETSEVNPFGASEANWSEEKKQKESEQAPKLSGPAKLPCKEREISTLILLQDGQTNDSNDPKAPPPLSLTTTSSSRSVSMLLKENCFQADIGLCDAPNGSQYSTPKHVNRLEVPLQSHPVEDIGPGAKKETMLDSTPTHTNISPKLAPPLETKGEPHHKEPLTPRRPDMGKISRKSPLRETQAVTTLSERSSYTQQQSVTEETHTTSYIQESTVVTTSSNTGQPVVTVTSNFKQSPAPTSSSQQSNIASTQEQVTSVASSLSGTMAAPTTSQAPNYIKEPGSRAPMRHQPYVDKFRFYTSDDPPSYDERESFSPLHLTDLPPRRFHRYHPTCQVPPCSCAQESLLSSGQPSLQSPNIAPPAAPLLHPQEVCYPHAVPPDSQHEPRSDAQPGNLQSASPQVTQPRTLQALAPFQPLQHPPPVPAYARPLMQPRPEDSRQPLPGQRTDRQTLHARPPQQATQLVGGSPYGSHTHSPTSLESRPPYLCSPQSFTTSFSPEYGSEGPGGSGVLYPESGGSLFGQSPRRVLLDPETGKYFYVEVPVQPLRKMLFDPETGQYVEVLIPQSGLYPPSAVPYPSLHSPSMYPPQYMPYSVSPHSPTQPPRHPEVPAPPAVHQNNTGFSSPGTQGPKRESQNHPPLDQSYLESMYYVPTGMTASPNPTPPDFYHKLPPRPNSESKRS